MSCINYLLNRIAYLEDRLSEERDEERQIALHDELEDARDELRFEYADLEAELYHED